MYNSGNSSKNVTGASIVDGTVETVDIADDAVTADKLANTVNTDIATGVSGSTTAGDALPKTGGALTGAVTTNSTFDGRDVATDGAALDVLDLAINSAADAVAITINADEDVGIGTDTPGTVNAVAFAFVKHHIQDNATNIRTVVDGNGGAELMLNDQAASINQRNKALVSDNGNTYLRSYDDNGTPRNHITIDNAGNTTVNAGNLVIGTAGKGIDFSAATPDGTGSTGSEVLDDYEEGTWTPTVNGSTAGTIAYTYQDCKYTKVGGLVHASGRVATSSIGSAAGAMTLFGLPFSANISTLHAGYATGLAIPSGSTISAYVSGTTATMQLWDSTGGVSGLQMSEWSDNGYMMFSITYTVT
jgi:hypothetical protein